MHPWVVGISYSHYTAEGRGAPERLSHWSKLAQLVGLTGVKLGLKLKAHDNSTTLPCTTLQQ